MNRPRLESIRNSLRQAAGLRADQMIGSQVLSGAQVTEVLAALLDALLERKERQVCLACGTDIHGPHADFLCAYSSIWGEGKNGVRCTLCGFEVEAGETMQSVIAHEAMHPVRNGRWSRQPEDPATRNWSA